MSEHLRVMLPEDHRYKDTKAEMLRNSRIELVRAYLHNPAAWPDGIDWPHWDQPHEIWFTGHEEYWIPLAIAAQEQRDAQAERDAKAPPKRKPLIPRADTPADSQLERAKRSNTFRKTAERILAEARTRISHSAVKAPKTTPLTADPAPPPLDATKKTATENTIPVAGGATKKGRGRPRSGKTPLSSTERSRKRRERQRDK